MLIFINQYIWTHIFSRPPTYRSRRCNHRLPFERRPVPAIGHTNSANVATDWGRLAEDRLGPADRCLVHSARLFVARGANSTGAGAVLLAGAGSSQGAESDALQPDERLRLGGCESGSDEWVGIEIVVGEVLLKISLLFLYVQPTKKPLVSARSHQIAHTKNFVWVVLCAHSWKQTLFLFLLTKY